MKTTPIVLASFATTVVAQQSAWGQCGGIGWTGQTTCCVPGSGGSGGSGTTTTLHTTTSPAGAGPTASGGGWKWLGVSESCAEFGTAYPGTWGVDFTFPATSSIDTLVGQGYNIFRVPFAMERMGVGSLTASLSSAYLANYTQTINYITGKGAHAIIDPHNYGRYNGAIITDTSAFGSFWSKLASSFKGNSLVVFDTNNEYHDMDETLVYNLNQAAITAIRGTGATSQYIFVEGNSWTGAATWNTTNDSLKSLSDPQNKLIYEMHLYLDSDGSGTHDACASSTIGVERAVGATAWLKANKKLGVIGEFAGGPNSQCQTAVTGLLNHLKQNSDVWTGALYWAAGPWWGNTTWASFEPPSGISYEYYNSVLKSYQP